MLVHPARRSDDIGVSSGPARSSAPTRRDDNDQTGRHIHVNLSVHDRPRPVHGRLRDRESGCAQSRGAVDVEAEVMIGTGAAVRQGDRSGTARRSGRARPSCGTCPRASLAVGIPATPIGSRSRDAASHRRRHGNPRRLRPTARLMARWPRTRPDLELRVIVTGSHLAPEFGATHRAITAATGTPSTSGSRSCSDDDSARRSGNVNRSWRRRVSRTRPRSAASRPRGCARRPLRDPRRGPGGAADRHPGRWRTSPAARVTEGAVDDCDPSRDHQDVQPALHGRAADYRDRVIQLASDPATVFQVGADRARQPASGLRLLDRDALVGDSGIDGSRRPLAVCTFHPETLADETPAEALRPCSRRSMRCPELQVVFTKANATAGGHEMNRLVDEFVASALGPHGRIREPRAGALPESLLEPPTWSRQLVERNHRGSSGGNADRQHRRPAEGPASGARRSSTSQQRGGMQSGLETALFRALANGRRGIGGARTRRTARPGAAAAHRRRARDSRPRRAAHQDLLRPAARTESHDSREQC